MTSAAILAFALTALPVAAPLPQAQETIVAIQIHGNQITPDDEMVRLTGLSVGMPFTDRTIDEVRRRLEGTGTFRSVEVLKRFASIEDASRITVVVIVNEGPVRVSYPGVPDGPPEVTSRVGWRNLMFLPLMDLEDGHGLTLGVRVAYPDPVGRGSRLSFPLTFGGTKQVGAEFDRNFDRGPISRVVVGTGLQQRRNPAYDEKDTRKRVWGRLERWEGPFKAGGTVGWQRVSFGDLRDDLRSVQGDVTFDTRLDPVLPRNAMYVSASAEKVFFSSGGSLVRTRLDGRAYVGLFGQHVLVVRGLRESASEPAPPYLRSLLGGWSNLRGFKAGFQTGDTLVAGSIEWRIPLTSPLSIGKFGVSIFSDWGTAYDHGQRLADQDISNGIGGGVWFSVTALHLGISVAHGRGAGTRVNFAGGLSF